jgi:hypothetical protein
MAPECRYADYFTARNTLRATLTFADRHIENNFTGTTGNYSGSITRLRRYSSNQKHRDYSVMSLMRKKKKEIENIRERIICTRLKIKAWFTKLGHWHLPAYFDPCMLS